MFNYYGRIIKILAWMMFIICKGRVCVFYYIFFSIKNDLGIYFFPKMNQQNLILLQNIKSQNISKILTSPLAILFLHQTEKWIFAFFVRPSVYKSFAYYIKINKLDYVFIFKGNL